MFVNIDNKTRGMLKPIITMPNCLKCHGGNIDAKLERAQPKNVLYSHVYNPNDLTGRKKQHLKKTSI